MAIGIAEIQQAAARLAGYAVVTPVIESPRLNARTGGRAGGDASSGPACRWRTRSRHSMSQAPPIIVIAAIARFARARDNRRLRA